MKVKNIPITRVLTASVPTASMNQADVRAERDNLGTFERSTFLRKVETNYVITQKTYHLSNAGVARL
jgi:hypothetical protein